MKAASARSSRASAPLEHDEARARQLAGPLEVHQPERLAERRNAPSAGSRSRAASPQRRNLDVRRLVARRRARRRPADWGSCASAVCSSASAAAARASRAACSSLQRATSARMSVASSPPALAPADLLRERIAARLHLLGTRSAPRAAPDRARAAGSRPGGRPRRASAGVERLGILADPPDVEHGRPARLPSWRSGTPLAEAPPHPLAALHPLPEGEGWVRG